MRRAYLLPINVFPVRDPYDCHDKVIIEDFVNHPIDSDP